MRFITQIQTKISSAQWHQYANNNMLKLLARICNPAQASFELGRKLATKKLFNEAKFRFKFALWLRPNWAAAWYNLACCYMALGQHNDAISALHKSLALNPADESSLFLLAILDSNNNHNTYPKTTPNELIISEFTTRADLYDEQEVGEHNYLGHQLIYDMFIKMLGEDVYLDNILDAGCGTGLAAAFFRPHCKHLVAVDITPAMLDKAKQRIQDNGSPYYDEYILADIHKYLADKYDSYDVIIMANLCSIVGEITALLTKATKALRSGGWIFLSADVPPPNTKLEDSSHAMNGYVFSTKNRRFAHSKNYIEQTAAECGLQLHMITQEAIYDNHMGWIVALQKQ